MNSVHTVERIRLKEIRLKREREEEIRRKDELTKKIKEILNVSTRIKLKMMRKILGMKTKEFNENIISLATEFRFKIDGEYITIETEDVDDFITDLDRQFERWGKKEKNKDGKN